MPASSEATVVLPAALHARPAGALVRVAATFTAAIEVCYGERTASARGVLALMSLGALEGATVTVRAEGADADEAVRAVVEVLETTE